jgi:DNA-binding transcriptional ArsR family regulator
MGTGVVAWLVSTARSPLPPRVFRPPWPWREVSGPAAGTNGTHSLEFHPLRLASDSLRSAGVVTGRRDGKMVLYALTSAGRTLLAAVTADAEVRP